MPSKSLFLSLKLLGSQSKICSQVLEGHKVQDSDTSYSLYWGAQGAMTNVQGTKGKAVGKKSSYI